MTAPRRACLNIRLVPAAFVFCIAFSLAMIVFRPFPDGHLYGLSFKLSAILAGIWSVYRLQPGLVFTREMRIFVLVLGLVFLIGGFVDLNPKAEIVPHYASVFEALRSGKNPYTCGTIYHRTESDRTVLGNFNYPPMEIYPYALLDLLPGPLTIWVITGCKLAFHSLAALIFLWTFPGIRRRYLLPFLPLFLFLQAQENPGLVLLMTALILLAVKTGGEKPRRGDRYVIAVLFGIGLMTKFLVIPLMAAYYWHKLDPKKLRSLLETAVEVGMALATSVLLMAPFGVAAVLRESVLFNLVLKERNAYTTFFPNVLSGLFSWIRLPGLYPFAGIAIFGLSVLAARRLNVFSAMLSATITFLLVSPTPRPEFIPLVIYVGLVGILADREKQGKIPPEMVRVPG